MTSAFTRPTQATLQNRLLRAVPSEVLDQLWPHLEWMSFAPKTLLLVLNEPVHHVFFVEIGSVSMIAMLENGEEIEVGLVGA